ncbi:MAG: hypothetical protein QM775_14120 [Pirellulales bacterium]
MICGDGDLDHFTPSPSRGLAGESSHDGTCHEYCDRAGTWRQQTDSAEERATVLQAADHRVVDRRGAGIGPF